MREGQDGRKFVVFVSDECHYSCTMAANVLGLGYDNLVKVDVDESGCMDTADLDRRVQEAKKSRQRASRRNWNVRNNCQRSIRRLQIDLRGVQEARLMVPY